MSLFPTIFSPLVHSQTSLERRSKVRSKYENNDDLLNILTKGKKEGKEDDNYIQFPFYHFG